MQAWERSTRAVRVWILSIAGVPEFWHEILCDLHWWQLKRFTRRMIEASWERS